MSRLLLAIGVAALLGAAALVLTSRPPSDVGEALAPRAPGPTELDASPSPSPTARPTPTASSEPTPAPPAVATRSARLADVRPATVAPPVRLAAPAVGIDAPIVAVGVEPDGQMEIPTDVDEVGWYRHGPSPDDDAGSVVLAGHVDSRSQGRGAFFALQDLGPGDEVVVTGADGTTTTWTVTGRSIIDKEVVPLEEVFRRDGPPRLVLVTCGGDFDAARRSYRSNIVVIAERAAS